MKARFAIVATVVLVLASACSSSGSSKGAGGGGGDGLDATTTVPSAQSAACKNATLTAPEVGITAKTLTVTVVADVQNGFRPGLFKGSWDGMKAWGDYMNAKGGLACRQIVVKTADSHLNPGDSKSAIAQACGNSFATIGTTALFLDDVKSMDGCKDKAGKVTGLPDIALTQTSAEHQCSPVSFAALPTNSACPYSGSGVRAFTTLPTMYDYYVKKYGSDLHGVFMIPKDTPSTIASSMPVFRGYNEQGVKSDAEFGMSGLDTQPKYTPVVQAIKQHKSTFASSLLDFTGMVLARKEADVQGVNDQVKVWDCQLNCYDDRLISEGGSAVEGTYSWLSFLPFEDKGANPLLDSFLEYDKKPDAWGMQAFIAGLIFERAVNDAMAANGNDPNAVTRANVLTALRGLHDFDAGGLMAKTDVGNKTRNECLVGMQVQNGKFVRVDPPQAGTFDCDGNKPPVSISIDPFKEYKG